jgi:hypothetical protein
MSPVQSLILSVCSFENILITGSDFNDGTLIGIMGQRTGRMILMMEHWNGGTAHWKSDFNDGTLEWWDSALEE